jgi:endonuclease VIII
LDRALTGEAVTRFETVLPQLSRVDYDSPVAGRKVDSVRPAGKWVVMTFSGDLILLTHMRMNGSWHIYRPGESWQRSRADMRIVIETKPITAVAFNVQVAEFHTAHTLARREGFNSLGPDLLAPGFDAGLAVANLASRPDLEIGSALLSQSLLAGIGNIYRSEVCFACRVNPFCKVGSLEPHQLAELVTAARRILQAASAGRREMLVYRRAGEPCRRCRTAIESRRDAAARVTFWCPHCQPSLMP